MRPPTNPDSKLAEKNLGDENLQALADWFDRQKLDGYSEAVRDWHIARDGPWRQYAEKLIFCLSPPVPVESKTVTLARTLLRTPRHKLRETIAHL